MGADAEIALLVDLGLRERAYRHEAALAAWRRVSRDGWKGPAPKLRAFPSHITRPVASRLVAQWGSAREARLHRDDEQDCDVRSVLRWARPEDVGAGMALEVEHDGAKQGDGPGPAARDRDEHGALDGGRTAEPAPRCLTCNTRCGCPACAVGNNVKAPRVAREETRTMTMTTSNETSRALARPEAPRAALAHPSDFGPEHMRIVREAFASGASQAEFEVMWAGAKARGLDPVKKQIFFIKRWDSLKGAEVWSSQVSIDGFRSIAVSSRHYDGQDEPEFEYAPDGALVLARVRVWRKGVSRPFVGVARWNEYVQTKKGGEPTHMWQKMEHTMLGKCAEALSLRKAFPEELGGLYSAEEMEQASNESPPAQWRQEPKPAPALPPAVVTAKDMLDRIQRADTPDALLAIIRQARTWPKVRGNAWLRMLSLCDTPERVEEARILFEADELPPEILTKLDAAAIERGESLTGERAA